MKAAVSHIKWITTMVSLLSLTIIVPSAVWQGKKLRKKHKFFCEKNCGMSKSDGLGGIVKSYASRAVCGERQTIRNAKELVYFSNENLLDRMEGNELMLNRLFF